MSAMSLLDHFEKIVSLTGKRGFSPSFFEKAKPHLEAAAKAMGITELQAAIFAHFLNQCDDNSIRIQDMAASIQCGRIRLVKYMDEFDALEKKRLIRCRRGGSSPFDFDIGEHDMPTYRVPAEVVSAVRKGTAFVPPKRENISIAEYFDVLGQFFTDRTSGELSWDAFIGDLKDLNRDNGHLALVKKLVNFDDENMALFLRFCERLVNDDDDALILRRDFNNLFESNHMFRAIERELKSGCHCLLEANLIENYNNDGLADTECYRLTGLAKEEFLGELNLKEKTGSRGRNFIKAGEIKAKKLFYNEKDTKKVEELTDLLREKNFCQVQKRLEKNGLRKGFACLFYGPPGTGKTETAYQIARKTGRDILAVDISETKSKWVGESEKLIKQVFDRYRGAVKAGGIAPILLFNEADALINKRMELSDDSHGVDKMENSMQNIILQEIENLEGILIATTNLTKNLDSAFERRFLYKIEFDKPNLASRKNIWRAIIRDLPEEEAAELAGRYEFTGGQIENIARRRLINAILNGEKMSLEMISAICRDEYVNCENRGGKIGF